MQYALGFLMATGLSLLVTPVVRRLAFKIGAVDVPGEARRVHKRPTARLGGLAIFAAIYLTVLVSFPPGRQIMGLLGGVIVLLMVGIVDDMRGLSPWTKLGWQILAACLVLAGGIGIVALTNPFSGEAIGLTWGRFAVDLDGLRFHVTPIGNALSILWMVGMVNVINFLDGLDGLATGVSGIAALTLFLLSISPIVNQPEVALLAIIVAGACLGFLPYNFFPARIFLGDSGAYVLGMTLALLAIYSGGKLATAVLVLGFTIVDGIWTVIRRLKAGSSPFKADRLHLHHLLHDSGWSQRRVVLTLYLVSALFGAVALASGSFAKLIALIVLVLLMAATLRRLRPVI